MRFVAVVLAVIVVGSVAPLAGCEKASDRPSEGQTLAPAADASAMQAEPGAPAASPGESTSGATGGEGEDAPEEEPGAAPVPYTCPPSG